MSAFKFAVLKMSHLFGHQQFCDDLGRYSFVAPYVTAAMLVERTMAKKSFENSITFSFKT